MEERIATALDIIAEYGGIDGDHHKAWVLDQVVRVLAAGEYDAWVAAVRHGEDGPNTYYYDHGIAP